jgi:secondary thiamine-phosphate synthase enzyme
LIRHRKIEIATRGPGLYEFTDEVRAIAAEAEGSDALLTLFVRHTSCSLLIQENADPDVVRDLKEFFRRIAPPADDPSMAWVRHRAEGPDDMPAHIRAALTPVSLAIPVADGTCMLGTWQGVYLFEHRDAPMRRTVIASLAT